MGRRQGRDKTRLNLSWVTPNLAVGGRMAPEAAEILAQRCGIRRVVDLREEDCDDVELLRGHGVAHLYLPTPDQHAVSLGMLWTGVQWVVEGFHAEEKALSHCEYGIGRSVL